MLESLGCLYTLGFPVHWEAVVPEAGYVSLPGYPWQKERYWTESEKSVEDRLGLPGHVFLNSNVSLANPAWQVELNEHFFSYLKDHRIENAVVFPAAGYVEAGLALSENISGKKSCILKELVFRQVLVADDKCIQKICLNYNPKKREYSVLSNVNDHADEWKMHATGRILPAIADDTPPAGLILKHLRRAALKKSPVKNFIKCWTAVACITGRPSGRLKKYGEAPVKYMRRLRRIIQASTGMVISCTRLYLTEAFKD